MRVVELADEFAATTAETLDWCQAAGVAAADGGSELTEQQCAAVRAARAAGAGAPQPPVAPSNVAAPPGLGGSAGAPPPGAPPFAGAPPPGRSPFTGAPPPGSGSFAASLPPAAPAGPAPTPGGGLALGALIASLLGICIPVVPALVGIVAGTVAKRSAAASPIRSQATGRATAAQAIGVITIVLWLLLYGMTYKSSHTTATLSDGTTVSVRKVLPKDIGLADCYVTQDDALVAELFVADCDGPHDAEIFGGAPATFSGPGTNLGVDACMELAEQHGVLVEDIRIGVLSSGGGSVCVARHNDGRPYTGRLVNP